MHRIQCRGNEPYMKNTSSLGAEEMHCQQQSMHLSHWLHEQHFAAFIIEKICKGVWAQSFFSY